MNEVIQWQGSAVDVRARLVPRFLWTTASIDVFLEGQRILNTGGQMKITGSRSASFSRSGKTHTAKLSWGVGLLRWFPYKLQIDGTSVSEARVFVENWAMGLILPTILMVLTAGLIGLAFYFFRHATNYHELEKEFSQLGH